MKSKDNSCACVSLLSMLDLLQLTCSQVILTPTFDFREVAAGVLQHSQDTGCISLWTVLSSILSSFQGKSEASKPWGLMPGVM